jgi:integrase/recombinase XerD
VAIPSFLSFLHQEGYIDTNIANKVILPFSETTRPSVLTQTECNKLRSACAENARHRAIVDLLLQTGIKLSELVNLTLNDIQLEENDRGFIRVLGSRRKKERLIYLNTKAYVALKDYFNVRERSESNILFLNRFGEALGERRVQKMLRKYLKRAEIGKASIHTLRHTFGASRPRPALSGAAISCSTHPSFMR